MVVYAYGNRGLDKSVSGELEVEPLFRHYPYSRLRGGPYLSYLIARSSFLVDLRLAWARKPCNFIFFHSVMAPQLAAIALWLRDFEPSQMPFVIIGFDLPSGNKLNSEWSYHTPFYRTAGKLFRSTHLEKILFFTFDPVITSGYAELLNLPVRTMPTVHAGLQEPRLRKRDCTGAINIAFLGHQRPEKGHDLIPEIIKYMLDRRLPVKALVHNSAPGDSGTSRELRRLAALNKDITLVEEPGDQTYWLGLLDRSDLIVLPYEPNRYRESGSGVATEAVSVGIPMVVPLGTTMETLAVSYQGCATTFSRWVAKDVANAIERAVTEFEALARQALAGALVWRRDNGVELFVDRLLEMSTCNNSTSAMRPLDSSPFNALIIGRIFDVLISRLGR
jgi:glycosyltransferase involved in cell wall biosynthesis